MSMFLPGSLWHGTIRENPAEFFEVIPKPIRFSNKVSLWELKSLYKEAFPGPPIFKYHRYA